MDELSMGYHVGEHVEGSLPFDAGLDAGTNGVVDIGADFGGRARTQSRLSCTRASVA